MLHNTHIFINDNWLQHWEGNHTYNRLLLELYSTFHRKVKEYNHGRFLFYTYITNSFYKINEMKATCVPAIYDNNLTKHYFVLWFQRHERFLRNSIKKQWWMQISHTHTQKHVYGRNWHLSFTHAGTGPRNIQASFNEQSSNFPNPLINIYRSTVRISCAATITTGRTTPVIQDTR